MLKPRRALDQFWEAEESLSVLLVLLIVVALILPAVRPGEAAPGPLTVIVFSCMLVAGAATAWRHHRWVVRAVAVMCLIALPGQWLTWARPGDASAAWNAATEAVVLLLLALVVLSTVLRAGTITRRQIEGGIAAYLLLGLAWASAYRWLALADPLAFAGVDLGTGKQWIYYSLVTLTTMGYGDITPVHPVARSLAVAEALTGQLYVAILISRLVALELQAKHPRT
jgi:hypothetical protein